MDRPAPLPKPATVRTETAQPTKMFLTENPLRTKRSKVFRGVQRKAATTKERRHTKKFWVPFVNLRALRGGWVF